MIIIFYFCYYNNQFYIDLKLIKLINFFKKFILNFFKTDYQILPYIQTNILFQKYQIIMVYYFNKNYKNFKHVKNSSLYIFLNFQFIY